MKIDLAICAIVKNEAPYIKEWIDYHLMLGVQKFYIYNNESTDNLLSVLAPYIYRGIVEYHEIEGYGRQIDAYKDCINNHKQDVFWLALIDIDEFIVPITKTNLVDFLDDYKEFPALGINWVMFDYNKHISKPKGSVIENYTRCHYDYNKFENHHIKSIIRPEKVIDIYCPHFAIYQNEEKAVDENKQYILGDYNLISDKKIKLAFTKDVSVNKIRINHYWSKSFEEVLLKINRGRAACKEKRVLTKDMYRYSDYTYDFAIYKYALKLYPWHFFQNTCRLISCYIKSKLIQRKHRNTQIKQIDKSGLFDKKFYCMKYHIGKNINPIEHYLHNGWLEGYNPSQKFDTNLYLKTYPDVKNAKICPLVHYINWGEKEGRKIFKV